MDKQILEHLRTCFKNTEFLHENVDFGGVAHAFFVKCSTEKDLESSWAEIRSLIGVHFQSKLIDSFEIWNVYIFFLSPNKVSKELKHAIEHDTLSSRKIVLDDYPNKLTKKNLSEIIAEHITNSKLSEPNESSIPNEVEKNDVLISALRSHKKPSAKKDFKGYYEKVLSEIEKELKDEI